jgi:hypothetical protein
MFQPYPVQFKPFDDCTGCDYTLVELDCHVQAFSRGVIPDTISG